MFCYQCEQASKGSGCTTVSVCGKDPETAALQDLLVHTTKQLARIAWPARKLGVQDAEIDLFVLEALFTTVTNVNFDPERVAGFVTQGFALTEKALESYKAACVEAGQVPTIESIPERCRPAADLDGMVRQGYAVSIDGRMKAGGPDITGLQELVMYGIKGTAAYADHALVLGVTDQSVSDFFLESLAFLTEEHTAEELTGMALRVGEVNITVMAMLDRANTGAYGHPEPTAARITPVKGKCILVSGHELRDLAELLEQTKGKGINIYTHGEMLPALAYPALKRYPHLIGNYGGAWQDQASEFAAFPGAILMTTNCIQRPRDSYHDRIFTSGLVAWPGVKHIGDRDFTPVIEAALAADGYDEDALETTIMVGFGHNAVLGVADKVIDAVKAGAISRFFLIGGCDGAKSGRNYYTNMAEAVPDDAVILTLACGKFRFNKLDFGDIGGIPRLLDMGQCNDAYSAVVVAMALAEAFGTDVNGLPLSMVLSWYEQKAVCILLSLLHLGVKDIRLGPSLPAFVTPPVLQVLVDAFGIKPLGTVEADLAAMMAGA